MAKASLNDIYDRIHGVTNYHPFTATTYADWSLEAGDTVTIGRDETEQSAPVHTATMRWNGRQQISLEARGEKTRGPVAKMSAKAFNGGGNGGSGYRSGGRRATQEKERYTDLVRTDERIEAYAVDTKKELTASIAVQANRISVVVEGTGSNAKVKPAVIEAAITDSNGYLSSNIKISADKIMLDGTTTINQIFTVGSGGVYFKRTAYFDSGGTSIVAISGNGIHIGGNAMKIANATANGNVLTITHTDGSVETFSKATTLSGKWSGGKYTVTAKQNSESVGTNVTQIKRLYAEGSVSVIDHMVGQTVYVHATENGGNNSVSTGFSQQIWIDAEDVYQQGKTDGAGGYTLFGKFTRYGSVSVEGKNYMAYITDSTSEYIENVNLYRK